MIYNYLILRVAQHSSDPSLHPLHKLKFEKDVLGGIGYSKFLKE